jgi:hypothetical protein
LLLANLLSNPAQRPAQLHEWTDAENALLVNWRRAELPIDQIARHFKTSERTCYRQLHELRERGFNPQLDWPGILEVLAPLFPTMERRQQMTTLDRLPEDQREILRAALAALSEPPPAPAQRHEWADAKKALLVCLIHARLTWDQIRLYLGTSLEACKDCFLKMEKKGRKPNWKAAAPQFAVLPSEQQKTLFVQLKHAMQRLAQLGYAVPQDTHWKQALLSRLSPTQRTNFIDCIVGGI